MTALVQSVATIGERGEIVASESAPGLQIMLRTYVARVDEGFVTSNWARHVRELPLFSSWRPDMFNAHMQVQARHLTRSTVTVAAVPSHPDQCFGFVVGRYIKTDFGDVPALDFIYVRKMWRQKGMATQLMKFHFPCVGKDPIFFTHPMRAAVHFKKRWQLVFNPYLAEVK